MPSTRQLVEPPRPGTRNADEGASSSLDSRPSFLSRGQLNPFASGWRAGGLDCIAVTWSRLAACFHKCVSFKSTSPSRSHHAACRFSVTALLDCAKLYPCFELSLLQHNITESQQSLNIKPHIQHACFRNHRKALPKLRT